MLITKERPNFGKNQIRSSKELKIGDMVIPVYFKKSESDPVEIVGYRTIKLNEKMHRGFLIKNSFGKLNTIFYADKGLIPYCYGWNRTNWLKKYKN